MVDLVLAGGTIHARPGDEPLRDGVVLIEGTKIAAIHKRTNDLPRGVRTIDCSGLTILPGFWNSHVHFFERKWMSAAAIPAAELTRQLEDTFTRFGFTSVFDLSSTWSNTRTIRDRIEAGDVSGPRIYSTGEGLVQPGMLPSAQVLNMMGTMPMPMPEVADAEQAANAAARLLDEGVDGIKLFLKSFPERAIAAVVSAARDRGKPVFAHPTTGADVLAALRDRVDVIAHTTPHSGAWDETILAAASEYRVALTPTLALWKYFLRHDRVSAQEQITNTAIGQLRAWHSTGHTVLFGTDLGAVDPDPSDEYVLMSAAGMSFAQILESLTSAPADRFGASEKCGRIAEGLDADLVVVDGDPAQNIRALAAVRYTLRGGRITHRG